MKKSQVGVTKLDEAGRMKRKVEDTKQDSVTGECPPGIAWLIELVNYIPLKPSWVKGGDDEKNAYSLLPLMTWRENGADEYSVRIEMNKLVEQLPEPLKAYVKLHDIEEIKALSEALRDEVREQIDFTSLSTINEGFERVRGERTGYFSIYRDNVGEEGGDPRFNNVFRARRRLIKLLAAQELLYALASEKPEYSLLVHARLYRRVGEYDYEGGLYIDESGGIRFAPPSLIKCFKGVDSTRILMCPVCLKIFWAAHRRMRFCSKTCGTTARVRELRRRREELGSEQPVSKAAKKRSSKKRGK